MAEEMKACRNCGGKCDPTGWMRGDGRQGPECEGCGITTPDVKSWNRLMGDVTPWISHAERRPMDWGDPDGSVEVQVSDGIKTGTGIFFKKSGAMGWKRLEFTNVKFWQSLAAVPKL